jgi:hypothetical protein
MLPRPPVTTSDAATSVTDPVGRSSSGVACCVVGGNKASGGGLAPCLDDELAELSGVDRRQLDADPAVAADIAGMPNVSGAAAIRAVCSSLVA